MLAAQGVHVDLSALSWDDPEVYELLQRGDTVGVFQLESEGMRRTLSAVRPTAFGDIVALVALYRPGPMDNIGMFGDRKNGRVALATPHPLLEELLKETYGIFVYQEQVMEAAKVIAGSPSARRMLRRAMGKKIQSEMDAQRAGFVAGCERVNGIPAAKAEELFDLIDKFAGYGFNKSHAAGYALIAYQTAWLKAHHRAEFTAASMSFDMAQTDKLALFVEDIRRAGVECQPPCVNASRADFSVEDGKVRYALGALKGVGEKAMEALAPRGGQGAVLASRISPPDRSALLNKRRREPGGPGRSIHRPRPCGTLRTPPKQSSNAAAADERTAGSGLFGCEAHAASPLPPAARRHLDAALSWRSTRLFASISGHPVDSQKQLLAAPRVKSFAELAQSRPRRGGGGQGSKGKKKALVREARWRTSGGSARLGYAQDSSAIFRHRLRRRSLCRALSGGEAGGCGLIKLRARPAYGDEGPE